MNFLRQSLIILLSIGLAMFFKSLFSNVIASLLGALAILYLIVYHRNKIENFNIFILITFTLTLTSLTGEISSPLFFLLYLLIFGVAFVFDPKVVFVFTIGLIVALFPGTLKTDLTRNLILLFSLFLVSPIAFFLGVNFHEKQEKKKNIKAMEYQAQMIDDDIEEVLDEIKQI